MLLAILMGIPLWAAIPGYFAIGAAWALAYLPYGIARQAKRYKHWKETATNGLPLEQVLLPVNRAEKTVRKITPQDYLDSRGDSGIGNHPLRSILIGFILSIAFWPCSVVDKVVRGAWPAICEFFRLVERVLCQIVRLFRWFFRMMDAIQEFFSNLYDLTERALKALGRWLYRVFQLLPKFVRAIWRRYLSPIADWVFKRVLSLYQYIIQFANREAIADLAALEKTKEKVESK